ncbi:serine/threonine-protein kinase RsbW [Stella humosa]|uniref:Serine/threonine-protein kinase RsbW n=1 Tax=Stella humosa TaxID=94 RepID=A0A3N1M931_9PROT|nr:ATP-binding protein [Stella humosa]ROP99738.1 serine/threonine-protein kinase RsbW [Stella humosa]
MPARTIRISKSLEDLQSIAEFVETFCAEEGVADGAAFHLSLVVEEAASNVVRHAYAQGGTDGTLSMERSGDSVTVEIVDDGPAFDPLSVPPPDPNQPLMEREIGGLGVEMIRRMTDRQDYRRDAGRNRLTLVKQV